MDTVEPSSLFAREPTSHHHPVTIWFGIAVAPTLQICSIHAIRFGAASDGAGAFAQRHSNVEIESIS
jgi:hypothetical protein